MKQIVEVKPENMNYSDTIYALSTSPQRSGVSIVRVSGANAKEALLQLTRTDLPKQRFIELRTIFEPSSSEIIDRCLVTWFESPNSFTGEDVVEFHTHGSPVVIRDLLDVLKGFDGFRHAEPGEFTRRAFHLNKINLAQVEALADLISAETTSQRRLANKQMEGALGIECNKWRSIFIDSLAQIEAEIEFPDIDNVSINIVELKSTISNIVEEIHLALKTSKAGQRIRSGIRVALVGKTNVGKSSIINQLAKRNISIVSETSGTTRDVVEAQIEISGYAITISDTAGFSNSVNPIEIEGIKRAQERAKNSDIVIQVFDITDSSAAVNESFISNLDNVKFDVFNKSDLVDTLPNNSNISLSCKTGFGFDNLQSRIILEVESLTSVKEGIYPIVVRHRQKELLEECVESLNRFLNQDINELLAEDLRLALRSIGKLVGHVSTEEMLDKLFNDFCIGK
tara:strand:+ start:1947 stop:3311 length:1365 start_codon:yes stop_codon:yes gene_type:complete